MAQGVQGAVEAHVRGCDADASVGQSLAWSWPTGADAIVGAGEAWRGGASTVVAKSGFAVLPASVAEIVKHRNDGVASNWHQAEESQDVRVASYFLDCDRMLTMASFLGLAAILRCDRRRIPRVLSRSAAALLGMARERRHVLDMSLAMTPPRENLIQFTEVAAYDETPLETRVARHVRATAALGDAQAMPGASALQDVANEDRVSARQGHDMSPGGALTISSSTPMKIVQARLRSGMVVRVGDTKVTLAILQPCQLALLERTTAIDFKRVQERLSHASIYSRMFLRCTRVAATDSNSAIGAAEAAISSERWGPQSTHLRILCDVHKTSGVHEKTLELVSDDISGMIRTALAIRNGSAMARFQTCLAQEIESRLEVLQGQHSAEAVAYTRNVLRVFCSHGPKTLLRRHLLVMVPNADWRAPNVQFYVNAITQPSLRQRP